MGLGEGFLFNAQTMFKVTTATRGWKLAQAWSGDARSLGGRQISDVSMSIT